MPTPSALHAPPVVNETKIMMSDPTALGVFGLAMVTFVAASQKMGWTTGSVYVMPMKGLEALAAIYAEQVIGFRQSETMVLIFVLNIAAALGAFGFGFWQDRIGHKRALAVTLVGWVATCVEHGSTMDNESG